MSAKVMQPESQPESQRNGDQVVMVAGVPVTREVRRKGKPRLGGWTPQHARAGRPKGVTGDVAQALRRRIEEMPVPGVIRLQAPDWIPSKRWFWLPQNQPVRGVIRQHRVSPTEVLVVRLK